jgi:hypothetical protein
MSTSIMKSNLRALRRLVAPLAAVVMVAGCASVDQSVALDTQEVLPIAVGDTSPVDAYDLASAMLRAGFSNDDVLRYGPDVNVALATAGGAQIRQNKMVSALFAVHGDKLYVTSRTRGTFVVPITGA